MEHGDGRRDGEALQPSRLPRLRCTHAARFARDSQWLPVLNAVQWRSWASSSGYALRGTCSRKYATSRSTRSPISSFMGSGTPRTSRSRLVGAAVSNRSWP